MLLINLDKASLLERLFEAKLLVEMLLKSKLSASYDACI